MASLPALGRPAFWDDKDLFNLLYGSMPLFMPPTRTYWNTNLEKFLTSYHLNSSISRQVAFEEMTGHTFLREDRKIQQTRFSNGWVVTANFDNTPFEFSALLLAAKGFYATDGDQQEVFRILDGSSNLAVAYTKNRLFINPYNVEKTYKGIKTTGSLFLQNDTSGIHLAFIGKQTQIFFNPAQMPWKLGHAFSEKTGNPITFTDLGNGWLKLTRPAGESFVRFNLDSVPVSIREPLKTEGLFECYPNPASEVLNVTFELQRSLAVQVTHINTLGTKTTVLLKKVLEPGLHTFDFDILHLPRDMYVLALEDETTRQSRKIVVH